MTELPWGTLVPGAGLELITVPLGTVELGRKTTEELRPAPCRIDLALAAVVLMMLCGTVTLGPERHRHLQGHGVALLHQGVRGRVGREHGAGSACSTPGSHGVTTSPSFMSVEVAWPRAGRRRRAG